MNCANHPERERVAFCQNCGKALCQECARTVGTAVFCEPCLAARIAGAPGSSAGVPPYTAPGASIPPMPPPPPTGEPNPGLAALLGFIPGVGAMYNGQYAKGIVHLIVFAVLVSLADEHRNLRALHRRLGLLSGLRGLPDRPRPPRRNPPSQSLRPQRSRRAPRLRQVLGREQLQMLQQQGQFPRRQRLTPLRQRHTLHPQAQAGVLPGRPTLLRPLRSAAWDYQAATNPYINTPPFDPNMPAPRNRFPAGAIWLIGLGAIFLIGNTGLFHGFPIHHLIPFFLIGLGVWLFIHKMSATGSQPRRRRNPLLPYSPLQRAPRLHLGHPRRNHVPALQLQHPQLGQKLAALHHRRRSHDLL